MAEKWKSGASRHRACLAGAAVMLSLGMGLRQSLGLFMPLTRDIAITVADFHAGDRGAKSGMGLPATDRRRMGSARRISGHHGRRRGPLSGGPRRSWHGAWIARRHSRRRRADRRRARLYGVRYRPGGCLARGFGRNAQHGAGCGDRGGLARCAALGANRADAGQQLRLESRHRGLRHSGARDAAGRMVRGPRRPNRAAARIRRTGRRDHG